MDDEREALADVQHQIWINWMSYFFACCERLPNGRWLVPADKADRWIRQEHTAYADLTEKEKESDRDQADKIIAVLKRSTTPE